MFFREEMYRNVLFCTRLCLCHTAHVLRHTPNVLRHKRTDRKHDSLRVMYVSLPVSLTSIRNIVWFQRVQFQMGQNNLSTTVNFISGCSSGLPRSKWSESKTSQGFTDTPKPYSYPALMDLSNSLDSSCGIIVIHVHEPWTDEAVDDDENKCNVSQELKTAFWLCSPWKSKYPIVSQVLETAPTRQ